MQTLWQDLLFGGRVLLKKPGFTLIAVLTLALGIGATTMIFSVINRLLLNPLPYKDGQRLVFLWRTNPQFGQLQLSPTDEWIAQWRREAKSFEQIEAFTSRQYTLTGGTEPEEVNAGMASTELFSFLGVKPRLGRAFTAEETAARVTMLSHNLWQRRFGGDPKVIGQEITLNDQKYTIIGVLPAGFRLLWFGEEKVWLPLPQPPSAGPRALNAVARLRPGVTADQAQAEMQVLAASFEKDHPKSKGWVGKVRVPQDMISTTVRDAMPILAGAVGLVLLIACANIANLLLARNAARSQEMAIRLAFGASRWRVARQLLVESLLLALLGGVAGVVLAMWGLDLVIALRPDTVPQLQDLQLDRSLLIFAFGVSLLTSLLFGVLPAWQASRTDLNLTLKQGTRAGGIGSGQKLIRSALVVAEVALSLVLLIGAGLMIRSFIRLQNVDTGFKPENVLTLQADLPSSRYRNDADLLAFQQQWLTRVKQIPGVQTVEVSSGMPLKMGLYTGKFEIEGRALGDDERPSHFGGTMVGPDYFLTLGIPVLKGRAFAAQDTKQTSPVIVVNQEMARRFWPGAEAVGQRFRWNPKDEWATIIGVVGNVTGSSLVQDTFPLQIYYPNAQMPSNSVYTVMRVSGERAALITTLKGQLHTLDGKLPIKEIKTAEEIIRESISRQRFSLVLMMIFAGLALALAVVGLYGLMSYLVSQSTHEIGIRMALGAQTSDVLKLVVKQGMVLTLIGVALGAAGAFALTRLMSSLLFGVQASDPVTFTSLALLLTVVALLACYLPARRAAKVDPMVALRYE